LLFNRSVLPEPLEAVVPHDLSCRNSAASNIITSGAGPFFAVEYQPESLSEWLDVHQLVTKHWEQERLRRSNSALVESALSRALRKLLQPLNAVGAFDPTTHHSSISIANNPMKIAHEYYAGNAEERKRAVAKVMAWGITDEHIMAEALQMRAAELILLDRMDNYRANSKRSIQKNLNRRPDLRARSEAASIN